MTSIAQTSNLSDTSVDYLAAFGRVLIAAIFLWSGWHKLGMAHAVIGMIGSTGLPFPSVGYGISLAVELGAGTLVLLGWRTRFAAAVLAIFTLATAVIFHNHLADREQLTNFMKNVCMAGGLLQVVVFGGGAVSLDAWLRRPGL
jgi:putative oxidoreductase